MYFYVLNGRDSDTKEGDLVTPVARSGSFEHKYREFTTTMIHSVT